MILNTLTSAPTFISLLQLSLTLFKLSFIQPLHSFITAKRRTIIAGSLPKLTSDEVSTKNTIMDMTPVIQRLMSFMNAEQILAVLQNPSAHASLFAQLATVAAPAVPNGVGVQANMSNDGSAVAVATKPSRPLNSWMAYRSKVSSLCFLG